MIKPGYVSTLVYISFPEITNSDNDKLDTFEAIENSCFILIINKDIHIPFITLN
jgi:hypothetical protein